MKTGIKCKLSLLLIVALVFSVCPQKVFAADKTSVKVSNQKELNLAVKNPQIKKITISTKKKIDLNIKTPVNPKTIVAVNATNANIKVSGEVGSLAVKNATSLTIKKTVDNINITDSKLVLKVYKNAQVDRIKLEGSNDAQIRITNNGSIGTLNINCAADVSIKQNGSLSKIKSQEPSLIEISGKAKDKISVNVTANGKGTGISTKIPIKITAQADVSLTLKKGAEKSSITLKNEGASVNLINNTSGKITITDIDGNACSCKSGGNGKYTSAPGGVARTDDSEEAKKAEEAKKREEEAKKREEEAKARENIVYVIPATPTPTPPADQVTTVTIGGIGYTATTRFDAQGHKTETRYVNNGTGKLWKVEHFNSSGVLTSEDTYEYIANDAPSLTSIDCIKVTSGAAIGGNLNLGFYTYNNNSTDCLSYLKAEINASFHLESAEMMLRKTGEGLSPRLITESNVLGVAEKYVNYDRGNLISSVNSLLGVDDGATRFEKIVCSCENNQLLTVDAKFCNINDGFSESNVLLRILYDFGFHTNKRDEKDLSGSGGHTATTEQYPTDDSGSIITSSAITYNASGVRVKTEECDYRVSSHKIKVTTTYNGDGFPKSITTTDLTQNKVETVVEPGYSDGKLSVRNTFISLDGTAENKRIVKEEKYEYNSSGTPYYITENNVSTVRYTVITYDDYGNAITKTVADYIQVEGDDFLLTHQQGFVANEQFVLGSVYEYSDLGSRGIYYPAILDPAILDPSSISP